MRSANCGSSRYELLEALENSLGGVERKVGGILCFFVCFLVFLLHDCSFFILMVLLSLVLSAVFFSAMSVGL